jgi:phosphoesterase RecJ-like protein
MGMNDLILKSMDEAIEYIKKSDKIFIASHVNPDGDNVGSSLAMALALKKLNKKVILLKTDSIPEDYMFLPGVDLYQDYSDDLGTADVFIALDSSDLDRLGQNKEVLLKAHRVINIDHHITSTNFGHINIVDDKSAATGELIFYFLKRMDIDIDKDIATNLYTAINTDTGKFSYESVTSKTHRITAELIDVGISVKDINIQLYEKYSIERTSLFIKSLGTLNTYANDRISSVKVSQRMLRETNTSFDDTEGIVSFLRSIGPVEVSCLLKEIKPDEIKVSLRSKEYVDVSSICKVFGGGGHIRAAGCTIYEDLDTAESIIIKEIMKNLR